MLVIFTDSHDRERPPMTDYWQIVVEEAFDDAGINATKDQIVTVTNWVESSHDNYHVSQGHPPSGSHRDSEIVSLTRELEKERSKVHCEECNGHGRIEGSLGGVRWTNTQCWKCNGEGRHLL